MGKWPSIVLIEGGKKAVKTFIKLAVERIDWRGKHKDPNQSKNEGFCKVIWEGAVNQKHFGIWSFKTVSSELEGKKFFIEKNLEKYWEMAVDCQKFE